MMASLGAHAGFILASYVVFFVVVLALVAWVVIDGAAQRRALADLEARGIRRRSAPEQAGASSDAVGNSESVA
jgi:heme exporter protein D